MSFLTSAYRTEQYVGATIESVLAQTRTDWQLIVVDNGPSDEMARVVERYTSDPRITLIRQRNSGVGGGLRAAAAVAAGRYVCPLHSDDLLEPDYCARIAELVEGDPAIDAVGCDAILFWDTDRPGVQMPSEYFASIGRGVIDRGEYFASIGRKDAPNPYRSVPFTEMLDKGVPDYAGAFRREVWHAYGGFDPSADVEPDVALWLRLAAAGLDIRILPDKLVRQRMRPTSLSHDPATLQAFEDRLLEAYLLVGREYGLSESALAKAGMVRQHRYHRALSSARTALLANEVRTARNAAREAFRQRRTLRAAVVLGVLHVSPGLLRAVHPTKNRIENTLRRARWDVPRHAEPTIAGVRR